MKACLVVSALVLSLAAAELAPGAELTPPKAGKPEILPLADVKPGMHATAWTTFSGITAEPVPIEIIGIWRNAMGPRQHVIMAKMGGKAERTGVAGGMSGSPVYYEGKLIGAVALRLSQFSPDAICGITPIESMLEIQEMDTTRPSDARTPDKIARTPEKIAAQRSGGRASQDSDASSSNPMPSELVAQMIAAGASINSNSGSPVSASALLTPIDTPLVFSGFTADTLTSYEPLFRQMGITPVQGGSSAMALTAKPAAGWEHALNPGEAVSGILVSGDMSTTGMGTVTYNDGKRILAFGHQFFDLGPVNMPIARSEILTVLASNYQPNKVGNATEVVGALRQDRYTGIMGELGAEAPVIPVHVKVRAHGENDAVVKEKDLNFNIFVHEKWTPFLMSATLSNSLQQMNLYADEMTYRMTGDVLMDGTPNIHLSTMFAPGEFPVPMPNVVAGWWGEKFNQLFLNSVTMPKLKSVEVLVDLLPARRIATIENAWTPSTEVEAGTEIPVKVFLRPYRGGRIERSLMVKIPAGMPKGEQRIQFSDADTLDRSRNGATMANRSMDIPETVSVLNQALANNRLYVALVENRATYYSEDKTLPNLPASVANVLQTERNTGHALASAPDSTQVQQSISFDQVVSGSYSLRIRVK